MEGRYREAHKNPKGPGDARPTALQIIKDEEREGSLSDKVVFITGCSSGLGVETARALKATGATLFLTARNLEKARTALGGILDGGRVHLLKLDLESLASVRTCAEEFLSRSQTLNILIANAGVRLVPEGRTKDGFEVHLATNHLSHFLLFELLKPTLLHSSSPEFHSRVVSVSSTAHRTAPLNFDDLNFEKRKYNGVAAYGQSKLANVYMANEIERRYGAQGLHGWSIHPGGIRTGLQRPNMRDYLVVLKNGPIHSLMYMQNTEQGAATSTWAAVSRDLEGKGGKYLEECQVSQGLVEGGDVVGPGRAPWAYHEEDAKKLYDVSLKLVGLEKN
ncbi:hypothetical protein F5B22DRAFT_215737 [Xylaria bambusicola]|uniref:uncharacterized protein n=1 Tax=Xylaria bambusicola TaxID=326684 RepID=UPI0020084F7B|nr:uncharacterized protein F5B22DRAFT_215737 [Xylaria bambusicola]KAI0514781.1 hypothetical protein F5B22DRAFT_215737 [Xylaria bambusicola]